MAKKTVENQQPMSEAREAINDNFTELYNQLGGGSSNGGGSPTTNAKLKEYIDSFSQLGFDLPDAIIAMDPFLRMTVRYLQFVGSDIDYDGAPSGPAPTWSFLYRTLYTGSNSGDYHTRFKNLPDGPQDSDSKMQHADFVGKNLKWFVDNGYAIYSGGSSTTNTSSLPGVNHENFKDVWELSTANQSRAEFYTTLPDYIIIGDGSETETLFLHSISGPLTDYFTYQYQSIKPGVSNDSRNNVRFNTDLNGTLWSAANGHTNPQGGITSSMLLGNTSLKDFIDNDRAGYFSGSSSGYATGETWGVFDGTESGVGSGDMLTIQAGNNIQSIEYISTGMYEVTVINPMPSEFYHVSVGVNPSGYGGADGGTADDANGAYGDLKPTASQFRIDIRDNSNQQSNSDRITFHVVC